MSRKKNSSKLSAVKRGNRLRTKLQKQGKLKTRRNRNKSNKVIRHNPVQRIANDMEENSDNDEDVLDMIDNEDMRFLRTAVANKSYSFLEDINEKGEVEKPKRSKKRVTDNNVESEDFESQYEKTVQNSDQSKRRKFLLPIKTPDGLVVRSEEVSSSDDEEIWNETKKKSGQNHKNIALSSEFDKVDEIRSADLLAFRQNLLARKKMRIGILCSGLTESPEQKIHNFKPLIEMLNDNDPETCLTSKKLAVVSLQEVFKDLLPEYQIKHHNDPNVKLKKTVKQLQTFESDLLKYYKCYLKEIEKMVSVLKRKKGDNRIVKEVHINLAEQALKCLCDLFCAHPNFNFSKNIIHLLVPFLNNGKESVRVIVSDAIKAIFKSDKRGEVSLEIVRNINKFVKSRHNVVRSDVLLVLLSLNLKDVNLDKEKEDEIKRKKVESKKHKMLLLSKREKKRMKKFKSLQKDLLETKAEENRKSREQCMTEITKTVFTIYFRILKETEVASKLLNAALEGLAKFAHCINVEFYHDLIIVLDKLVQNEDLGYKEKLCCVWTVFTVLHYQGATIFIDPVRFYSHFYSNILNINAGTNHSDLPLILKTVDFVILKRRKHLSLQRLLAFTKRLTALTLQVLPHGTLALLSQIRDILQVNNSTDVLLDSEAAQGQGIYYPEMEEPEYCNAGATSLWELLPLQKHYHPTVREFASRLAKLGDNVETPSQEKEFVKQSPEQIFEQYNAENVKFNPAIPPPRKFPRTKRNRWYLLSGELETHLKAILKTENLNIIDINTIEDINCKK